MSITLTHGLRNFRRSLFERGSIFCIQYILKQMVMWCTIRKKTENWSGQIGNQWEKYILMRTVCATANGLFFRSEAESPPCPSVPQEKNTSANLQVLKAVADIILQGYQGQSPHLATQTTAFISEIKIRVARPQSRGKPAAEGWWGEVTPILRHYKVWPVGKAFAFFSCISWLFHNRLGQTQQTHQLC